MLFKSENMTQVSGSIAGVTYSHNKAGLYRRARSIPVNPNSSNQVQVRNAFTTLVNNWTNVLTPAQRTAWGVYAANVPVAGRFGDATFLSGQNWYIGCNTPRIQADLKLGTSLGIINDAPEIFDRGDFTNPVPTYAIALGLDIVFTNTDSWANAVGGAMLIYQGRPQNASINFYKGPWRLVTAIAGAETPPTSPVVVTEQQLGDRGFPIALGQRVWTMVAVVQADGRYNTHRMIGPDTVDV